MASTSRRRGPAAYPPFEPLPDWKQEDLKRSHAVWQWVVKGQEWGVVGGGNFLMRCRLCDEVFPGSRSRAVDHFTKTKAHCPRRTTEILWRLQRHGAQLWDAMSRRLVAEYADAMEEELAVEDLVGRGTAAPADASATQTRTDGGEDGRGAAGPDVLPEMPRMMFVSVCERSSNDLARLLALAMYRGGVPFNWLRLKETQKYWDYIVTLLRPSIVLAPRLLSYEGVRARMMDIIYHEVATLIAPKKAKWKDTGCTLMTDGATDQRNKPIMNFIAAGQSGPILIRTIDMSARDKTGVSLAKIWEGVIRDDIGVENVKAICTDNAEVMKAATSILQDHPDPAIARIPWIPCAAHCLSLLLRDIATQPWAAEVMKRAHKIIKFMRNKQKALHIHRTAKGALDLTRPADTRFGTAYMMLERLYEQRMVLDGVVSSDQWRDARWAGDARVDEPEVRRLCRSDWWWQQVKKVMDVMEPCYTFLRAMDFDGSSPPGLWDLESILWRKIDVLGLWEDERKVVFDIVADRCAMMRQPAHAAAYLLDPRRRDISLLSNRSSPVVQSTLDHFSCMLGGGWESKALGDLWEDLWTFQCDDPRYWPVDGPHWWDEVVLLSASRRPESRYIDVWADMVEDPPEEVDGGDVLPVDADEEEWEAAARANRHKDGRDRITSASRYAGDHGRMLCGCIRTEDTNTVEQVAEQVADHPRATQTVVQTVHQRVDCAVDDTVQERREEGARSTLEKSVQQTVGDGAYHRAGRSVEPRVGDAVTPTVEQRAEQRRGDRVEALVEQRTEQRAHMSRDCRVEQRAEQRFDVRVDVCVDQRLGHERVAERVGESVLHDVGGVMTEERTKERGRVNPQESVTPETTLSRGSFYGIPPLPPRGAQSSIRVDVGAHVGEPPQRQREGEMASSGGRGALDTVSSHERQGGIHSSILTSRSPSSESLARMPHQPPPCSVQSPGPCRLSQGSSLVRFRGTFNTPGTGTRAISPLGMPPLPARQPSVIIDDTKTSRAGRKRKLRGDEAGGEPAARRSKVSTGRPQGRPRGSGKGRAQCRQSWALSALADVDTETPDVSERLPVGRGIASGVCTRSQGGDGERRKVSSRVLDDDPDDNDDGNTSDEMSGSDYAEEARLTGGDCGGDGDGSHDTEDDAE
ncbi:hypothetical protein CBR_g28847 [Chara braunii]|uniref:DUF659 domain-containing protein n=1 Tax=Chara braunii TaxID=69332 RepID=A0A388LAC0_CHABU|nr:hypothetical protein CBR_g28847 [Chara braunii]|eukprot:GBG79132.1 hypothetical protein CBR_g28847 [Chara braunii]